NAFVAPRRERNPFRPRRLARAFRRRAGRRNGPDRHLELLDDQGLPREEVAFLVKLVELLPEDEGGPLEQVVGVLEVADQGMDVPVQPGLILAQVLAELGSPGLDLLSWRWSSPPQDDEVSAF